MMCRRTTESIPVVSAGMDTSLFFRTRAPKCGLTIVKKPIRRNLASNIASLADK